MKYRQTLKLLFLMPIVALFLVACNSDGEEIEQPEKIYYDQAQKRMASKNFFGAIVCNKCLEDLSINHCRQVTKAMPAKNSGFRH